MTLDAVQLDLEALEVIHKTSNVEINIFPIEELKRRKEFLEKQLLLLL